MHKLTILVFIAMLLSLTSCFRKNIQQTADGQPIQLALAPVRKRPENMTFDEACNAKKYYDQEKVEDLSIKCAQRMIALGSNQEEIRKATLELAEIFLKNGDYQKAQKYAMDYQTLYPGTPETIDASYMAIKANFYDTLSADRDQTKTHTAIELAQNFLEKYDAQKEINPHIKDYMISIKDMTDACYRKLLKSELNIAQTYLSKFNYTHSDAPLKSAHNRISYIKEKLLPHAKDQEPEVINFEIVLAQAGNKTDIVNQKKLELSRKFPEYSTSLAEKLKKMALLRF